MLLHLSPTFRACEISGPNVDILDITIPEFGLKLKGGRELTARRPHADRNYLVACRKIGRKAVNGILLNTGERVVLKFTVRARWAVDAEFVVSHEISYIVTDCDFSAATDDMLMWSAHPPAFGNWPDRMPAYARNSSPMSGKVLMLLTEENEHDRQVVDRRERGLIVERKQEFRLPTIEPARLINCRIRDTYPCLEQSIVV